MRRFSEPIPINTSKTAKINLNRPRGVLLLGASAAKKVAALPTDNDDDGFVKPGPGKRVVRAVASGGDRIDGPDSTAHSPASPAHSPEELFFPLSQKRLPITDEQLYAGVKRSSAKLCNYFDSQVYLNINT